MCLRDNDLLTQISIHALRGEGDSLTFFLPFIIIISIHALRGEGDDCIHKEVCYMWISIHALRGEGDRQCQESF